MHAHSGRTAMRVPTPLSPMQGWQLASPAKELRVAERGLHADLTDAARAEARYRALFAALREPILVTSADGCIAGFNAAAVGVFGGPARLYGRPIHELLPFVGAPEG